MADEAYGVGWNGSLQVPTKNAVYDKIEGLSFVYQPLDADLTAIAALGFTSTSFLKKTAADTWALDTTTYEPSFTKYDLAGTANQVSLSASGTGVLLARNITLSLPQDIHTGASPTFVTVKLTGLDSTRIPYHFNDSVGLADSGLYWDNPNGRLGLGIAAPLGQLHLGGTITATSAFRVSGTYSIASATMYPLYLDFTVTPSSGYTANGLFLYPAVTLAGGGDYIGVTSGISNLTISTSSSDYKAFLAAEPTVLTGTLDNIYGIYINSLTKGTANYAVYTAGTTPSVFGGQVTGLNFVSSVAIGTQPYAATSTTLNTNLNADLWDGYQFSDYLDQAVKQASSPTFATAKLTSLTDGYLPYHVSDASGLANSPIYTNGTYVSIGTATPLYPLHVKLDGLAATIDGNAWHENSSFANTAGYGFAYATKDDNKIVQIRPTSNEVDLSFGTRTGGTNYTRVTIDGTTGYFGINTVSPQFPLSVSADGVAATIDGNAWHQNTNFANTAGYGFGYATKDDNTAAQVRPTSNDMDLTFGTRTGSTNYTRMTIKGTTGLVGIGTTSPSGKLNVIDTNLNLTTITLTGYSGLRLKSDSSSGGAHWSSYNDAGLRTAVYSYGSNEGTTMFGQVRSNKSAIFSTGGTGMMIGTVGANNLTLGTNNAEVMRLTSSGKVGIGTTGPTAVLHLKAGTATASTAPFKLTAGTNLTTAEAGAMEYDGTSLYFTRAGTVRERIGTIITKTDTGDPTGAEGVFVINTFDNTFKVYADGAFRELATW